MFDEYINVNNVPITLNLRNNSSVGIIGNRTDLYEFLKYHNGSKFYPVKVEEIDELEKKLNLIVPKELKDLLLGIGYGFIKGSENNVNRIMDTDSIRDFRLRKGDFEFYPDIEIYDEYEDGKLMRSIDGTFHGLKEAEIKDKWKNHMATLSLHDVSLWGFKPELVELSKLKIEKDVKIDNDEITKRIEKIRDGGFLVNEPVVKLKK